MVVQFKVKHFIIQNFSSIKDVTLVAFRCLTFKKVNLPNLNKFGRNQFVKCDIDITCRHRGV